jgi:hypothetical protein
MIMRDEWLLRGVEELALGMALRCLLVGYKYIMDRLAYHSRKSYQWMQIMNQNLTFGLQVTGCHEEVIWKSGSSQSTILYDRDTSQKLKIRH